MNDDEQLDEELETLAKRLPETLQDDWVTVPKRVMTQTFLVGLLMGAAATLMFVGFALDSPNLRMVWPATLVTLMALTKWAPWWRGDRHRAQLSRAIASEDRNEVAQQD